jgi:hypothetical protein
MHCNCLRKLSEGVCVGVTQSASYTYFDVTPTFESNKTFLPCAIPRQRLLLWMRPRGPRPKLHTCAYTLSEIMMAPTDLRLVFVSAGKAGKTKFAIENATRTRIVLADSKIHMLGSFKCVGPPWRLSGLNSFVQCVIVSQGPSVYSRERTCVPFALQNVHLSKMIRKSISYQSILHVRICTCAIIVTYLMLIYMDHVAAYHEVNGLKTMQVYIISCEAVTIFLFSCEKEPGPP